MDFTQPTVSTGEVAEEWSSNLEDCLAPRMEDKRLLSYS
jgi:hypothetical protein